jgi:ketosteroid isomerase-like protein
MAHPLGCMPESFMKTVMASIALALLGMSIFAHGSEAVLAKVSAAATKVAAQPARMSAAECVVWNRELGFARSVEAHDATAFASYLHAGAVFGAGTAAPVRGRAAIVDDWKEIIEGRKFALRWHPGFVSIGGDPHIALSSGPAWTEDPGAAAPQRYSISRFTSTWVKDSDGQWRVLFDGAGAPRKTASAEDIRKLVAAQSATCPAT